MLEVEKVKKPPKRHTPSGSVGQEPPVCADTTMTRLKSPAATLASPSPEFNTRATNTFHGLGWGARGRLPETEVKLEFVDVDEKAGSGHRKIRPSGSQKGSERDLFLQRKKPSLLPNSLLVPSPVQVFLEEQEEGALGLCVCSEKRRVCSLGRLGLHPAASSAKCQPSPGQNKPKGDSRLCGLKSVLQQKPVVQPEKKVSKQKARGRREEQEPAGKKWRDPVLSSGQAPAAPALAQATRLDRSEVGQPSVNEEARRADILIACLAREVRRLKKWKKRHLLPGVGEKSPLLSLQKPPCLKKLVRTIKAETKGWASPRCSPGPLDTTGQKPTLDVRRFFTVDCKNICHITCTLCHASIRQGRIKGQSQTSGLVCHLVSKHGLERERRPAAASPGEKQAGVGEKQKGLPAGATSLACEGVPSPRCCPDASPLEDSDSDGQPTPGRPEQLLLDPPLLPAPTKDEPAAPPMAIGEDRGGIYAPNQPRAQAWNHSIAELLCSLALPLSFVSSPPFRKFMAQVDPCYHLPSPAFFSDKALPLLHEAMGEQVCQEMQWAEGSRLHLTVSRAAQVSVVDYVAITAHWGVIQPGSRQVVVGNLRKRAVLWVRGLPLESTLEDRQRELREQVSLWLGRGSLQPGFLVSSGCPSLEQTVRMEGYTQVPCFAHCLDSLVKNFLCHHHSVQIILGTARAICSHFQGSAEARRLLTQLQRQCGLPAQQPFWELSDHWVSTYRLMEWLVEQQQPLQEYEEKHQLGKAETALSAMFWSLTVSLVKLLQPFQVVFREAGAAQTSLSQVLPQLRYLNIFLEQVHGHFKEQSGGEMGAAVRLAEGLALQLSTDCQLNELFHREEFVLATLLDPRFKGKIEAILPVGADIDHWKQVLVYKVKEIMVSEYSLPPSPSLQSPRAVPVDATLNGGVAQSPGAEGKGLKEPVQRGSSSGSLLLGQREKSLLEQLESVGLLASKRSGASLVTENHLASVIVKKYLRENETVGTQEDPLAYWEKKREVWPALARLATVYLSCPATGAFSGSVFASLDSPAIVEHSSPLSVETVEHLLFLKSNLENFPNYTPPPLIFPGGDLAEGEQASESDLMV
ncbi:PREDICTED: ZBED6 C-terminal-like protein isoform X1 [Ceratotherium simum simum]|uniref:ZBED6 C-terminal-like protein isoform X1 n=1 Tax=Ceratotherium simum simum TaxID=73337 RepID=A0ABM0HNR1_CERSS|nr:PREDICTED: ZBED6 C-terminal-like protein isoform X1 [Ceratotherium simum simum]